MRIIPPMIRIKHLSLLFAFLTFGGLLACEPLAPDQTPQYVVVTGETPPPTSPAVLATVPPTQPTLTADGTPLTDGSLSTDGASLVDDTSSPGTAGGMVNTPEPSITPVPIDTAEPTATQFVCSEQQGQLLRLSYYSAIAEQEVYYRVYLPPCFYETFRRYPYTVLLHGTSFNDSMWRDLGVDNAMDDGIASGELAPMVLIMPDGGWVAEWNDLPRESSFEGMLLDELLPQVENDFCLWGSRQGRAIGGISRGGFWAFSIAFRNPDLFSAVGGHSPHFEPDNALPEFNPLDLAENLSFDKYPLRIYLDHGTDDYVLTYATRMAEILRGNGLPHDYLINPTGTHTMDYWRAHVAEYVAFYAQAWPTDPMALPSCLEPSPQ